MYIICSTALRYGYMVLQALFVVHNAELYIRSMRYMTAIMAVGYPNMM